MERESVFVRICRTTLGGGARHLVYPIGVETQLVSLCIPAERPRRRISRFYYTTLFFGAREINPAPFSHVRQ